MPVDLLFAMLRNPASTGAVLPSSRTLANAMAGAALGADTVIELGAGTGPVTEALLRRLPGVPLIAVELQPALARRLQARFPTVDVRQAAAKEVVDGLIERPGRLVLVSSLPFRSLPKEVAAATVEVIVATVIAIGDACHARPAKLRGPRMMPLPPWMSIASLTAARSPAISAAVYASPVSGLIAPGADAAATKAFATSRTLVAVASS